MNSRLILTTFLISLTTSDFEFESYELPEDQGRRHTSPIVYKDTLYLAGGLDQNGFTNPRRNVMKLNLKDKSPEWEILATIPDTTVPQPWFTSSRGLIEIQNKLYMACHDNRDGKIYEFDENDGTFTELSQSPFDVTEDCCSVGLSVSGNDQRIYIIGGIEPDNNNPTANLVYYSINQDQWFQAADLNVPRSHEACTVYDNKIDGPKIYIFGGVNRTSLETRTSMEIYDIEQDNWDLVNDILDPGRRSFGALAVEKEDSIILVAGDANSPGDPDGTSPLDIVQVFDVTTNTINDDLDVPQLNIARSSPGTTIYKKGGKYNILAIAGQDTPDSVQLTTEKWSFKKLS